MYASICSADLASLFCHLDLFTLLFAAICHDLDHPGLTNVYQVRLEVVYVTRHLGGICDLTALFWFGEFAYL